MQQGYGGSGLRSWRMKATRIIPLPAYNPKPALPSLGVKVQNPESASGEARSRRGLGPLRNLAARSRVKRLARAPPPSSPLTQVKNLSEAINQCLQRAGDCARKAAAESDPKIKADFLDTKRRWTALARNYEFAKRLTDGAKQNDKLPKVRTRY